MQGGTKIQGIYSLVLILSIIRIVLFNLNFINRKEVIERSHLKILDNLSIIELGILFVMNGVTTERTYIKDLNFLITKASLQILILVTIAIVIKIVVKNFILLKNENKKKIWFLIYIIIIILSCNGIGMFLFVALGPLYILIMLLVNIFFIIEFIIIFFRVWNKR